MLGTAAVPQRLGRVNLMPNKGQAAEQSLRPMLPTTTGKGKMSRHTGTTLYDDEDVFARYKEALCRPDDPVRTLELPAVLAFLGDVRGCSILDLACGDAWI